MMHRRDQRVSLIHVIQPPRTHQLHAREHTTLSRIRIHSITKNSGIILNHR